MRLTFVLPPLNLSGGLRVVAIYAELLQRRGHSVTLVCPPAGPQRSWRNAFKLRRSFESVVGASHFDGTFLEVTVLPTPRPVLESDISASDCVIATWWETAEWIHRFSPAVGAKVYFIQHHEVFPFLPRQRVRATYRMPLRKIVVARWLADVMRDEYGDVMVELVPNAVNHSQFFAAPRTKQSFPTVGLLYAHTEWKRFYPALEALTRLRESIPDLQVRAFGADYPASPLPGFVTYSHRPPQDALRAIYASCDVWVTASSSEGFNLPAMEAMACRTPVVATRTGWPAEAIVEGFNGSIVAVDDFDSLMRETKSILQLPANDWECMSQHAFETVQDSSWHRSVELFEQALQRAANGWSAKAHID